MKSKEYGSEFFSGASMARDLESVAAYPAPQPAAVEVRETHVSRVYLTGSDVYKVKKPVRFAFLDFRDVDARRRACEAEVVLNARLAAGVYLGVTPVRRDVSGRCHFGPAGEVVDWAVHMVRLPDAQRADIRLDAGRLEGRHIDALAVKLAEFHGRARCDASTSAFGGVGAIASLVRESFGEVSACEQGVLSERQAAEIERWQVGFIRDRARLFERRKNTGRIRAGHGDLRLEHVYFGDDGEVTVIDCIEFSERFRSCDVASDIAFLSMDLMRSGRVDLAERFLARYAREADDFELYALVGFYEAYRAYVRGKIAMLVARGQTGAARDASLAEARKLFLLSLSGGRAPVLSPAVVAVGGVIASGKSTVSGALGDLLSAPVIEADRTRKSLLRVSPTTHVLAGPFEGAYSGQATERVYAEMMLRASYVLESGRPVVLDASFRSEWMRRAARDLAAEHGAPFTMIECQARPEVCRERLARRDDATTASDGRLEIFDSFCAHYEAPHELPASELVEFDTERPLVESLEVLSERLEVWPRGLVA